MKILFICSSIELGRDGVGDYTRRLAGELIRQGNEASIIALHDQYTQKQQTIEIQSDENVKIETIRFSSNFGWNAKTKIAKNYVESHNPDWLSLQYVPYGFQNKGLPFELSWCLQNIGKNKRWHIMFHELWVGRISIQRMILSTMQEYIISSLIRVLKPQIIHTSIPIYYQALCKKGYIVKELPIFSNIPFMNNNNNNSSFRIVFFNQADMKPSILQFIIAINDQLVLQKSEIDIIFLGGNIKKKNSLGSVLEKMSNLKNKVSYTGFLEDKQISYILQTCRLGITSVPIHALGKSTTVAAFLLHGIPVAAPVILNNDDQSNIGFFSSTLKDAVLQKPILADLEAATKAAQLAKQEIDSSHIAAKFIFDLENC